VQADAVPQQAPLPDESWAEHSGAVGGTPARGLPLHSKKKARRMGRALEIKTSE